MINALKDNLGFYAFVDGFEELNRHIIDAFEELKDLPELRKTHFFKGRYENIYIERERIPALIPVLEQAVALAAEILQRDAASLKCGFWFNSMQPGHVTLPHTHDDDDELLSAVYYVVTPENSGNLYLGAGDQRLEVEPEPGKLVFFKPDLLHEVSENKSPEHRLSIGINFGIENQK